MRFSISGIFLGGAVTTRRFEALSARMTVGAVDLALTGFLGRGGFLAVGLPPAPNTALSSVARSSARVCLRGKTRVAVSAWAGTSSWARTSSRNRTLSE